MMTIRLFWSELLRLLHRRLVWMVLLLTVLSPLAGLLLYKPASADTMLSAYLANPAIAGGAAGGILFGLLTVFELDRPRRSRADALINAVVSPLKMALVRLSALLAAALAVLCITALIWFPVSRALIGSIFDGTDYALAYLLFMGAALPLAVLAAAAFYQLTQRVDLSLVLLAAFAGLSLTVWADNWQLCWLNPCVWALSDDFSNIRIFRSVAYMRLTWLLLLGGLWTVSYDMGKFSLSHIIKSASRGDAHSRKRQMSAKADHARRGKSVLCDGFIKPRGCEKHTFVRIRQYGRGLLGSAAVSLRRVYRPAAALLLLICSGTAYAGQPFVDCSNPDLTAMTFSELPYPEEIFCTGRTISVIPDTIAGTVTGRASYEFQNASGREQTAAFGVNPGYDISSVQANGRDVPFSVSDYQEYNEAMLEVELPADESVELTVEYGGFPQESRNMSTMQGSTEISETYLCLENAALAPRLINVLPDGETYVSAVEITLPGSMTVIPFGAARARIAKEHENGTVTWRYEENRTGGILYAGDYIREEIQAGGTTIEFYYGRRHQPVMESAGAADAVKAVVDYCTEHYGVLSFGSGDTLKLIQSRVSGGGYAADGASLLDEADFTAANLADGQKGAASGEVMIHELVHQWWGLGNMFDSPDAASAWSAEGLTVYTTYRIVRELYGEDYAREHYVEQWQKAVDDYYLNYYVRNPDVLAALPLDRQLEITENLTYVRQYCEMPLMILKAEELVGGGEAMDEILYGLFNRELDPAYPYLTYQEFLDACGLTEEDLNLA